MKRSKTSNLEAQHIPNRIKKGNVCCRHDAEKPESNTDNEISSKQPDGKESSSIAVDVA
jgi:hypothetical protein